MFSFLRLFLKQQKASAEQKNVYPWFLSERSQFPFFIAPDSAPIFDKGCKSTKIADVSNNEFSPPKQSHSIKLNPPFLFPERLITQWENLLCVRFITGPKSCPGFFYFTGRALLEKSDCCSWFPPLIQSASNLGRDLRSPEEIGDSYQSSQPNKTQRRWEIFSGMLYESRQNKGLFVSFGGQLEL